MNLATDDIETKTETKQSAKDEQSRDWPRHASYSYDLPEKPLVTIEAGKRWASLDLQSFWDYRELLYFLTWRDIKVRYKQTLLGAAWAIIQPLVLMIVFTYFFGTLARVSTENIPYPIFFYTGLTLWGYFSNSVMSGANSLIGNTNLITKVYFPRLIIPSAAVGAGLVDFAIASGLLIGLLVYYNFAITWKYIMLVPIVLVTTILTLAFGIWLAALNVKYRDIRYALPFTIQVWMFLSPIIYPASLIPDEWRWLMSINPVTGLIEGFRAALFDKPFDWSSLGYSAAFSLVLLVYASFKFKRMERYFAEYI